MAAMGQGGGEDLLMQIAALLEQYLAMGEDTPVAPEAAALLQSIQGVAGGGMPPEGGIPPEAGGMPPEAGGMPPMPEEPMGPEALPADMAGMGGGDFGSFGEADAALLEDMKKRKGQGR